jgi:hypothetical protein
MTFIPTQEQIEQAQEFGNATAQMCTKPIDQAIAYRNAYDAAMLKFELEANRYANTARGIENVMNAPLTDATKEMIETTRRIWRETEAEAY